MNFLPIVTRELAVAARRKSTFHIRLWSAVAAILVATSLLIAFEFSQGAVSGNQVFMILSSYAFGLCLLAGTFLTADCLSEEKREGTLGLLFLTDLKGYDVVLGKLMATSLNAFYALFALFPVLALPLLLGGVTAGEFWRTMLSLLNALFFSLALGIWISARARDLEKVMGQTLGWILFFVAAPPLFEQLRALARLTESLWFILAPSPFFPFYLAAESRYLAATNNFLISILASQLVAWTFIFRASCVLPRSWQEIGIQPGTKASGLRAGLENFVSRKKAIPNATRVKLLEKNPVLWLMSHNSKLSAAVWILTAIALVIMVVMIFVTQTMTPLFLSGISPILFLFKLLLAFRATTFFVEARRSSALELLLSTPLTSREIIHGQWLGLKQQFLVPAILLTVAMLVTPALSLIRQDWSMGAFMFFLSIYGALKFGLSIFAIGWFGMWMALSVKRPNYAAGLTILFVVILPLLAFCIPDVAVYLFFIFWSKGKLEQNFRPLLIAQQSR